MMGDSRFRQLFHREPRAEVADELAFHIEQRVRDYIARGMDPESARAAAVRRFGNVTGVRDECAELLQAERRDERRRDWMKMSLLDFKLGFRMLIKYPGLTLVGGLAMAFAITVGAAGFEAISQAANPQLPYVGADRIVVLRNWDAERNREQRRTLHDFVTWREELKSVDNIGAFRSVDRNLIVEGHGSEPVQLAEISATAFPLTGVRPELGRTLNADDERPDAPAVAVIGRDIWKRRFAGDPNVVGRVVRLGSEPTTIVGVMPDGYRFPVSHSMWVPLRANADDYDRGEGPVLKVFGRLAGGGSLSQAQAELSALGARAAADFKDTHEHLRPQVLPYAQSFLQVSRTNLMRGVLFSSNLLLVLFLVLVCSNVAALVFARTATRESEIVVRNALGASRGRILTQLFTESLVLGVIAAVIGVAAAGYVLRMIMGMFNSAALENGGEGLPFWFTPTLSPTTILWAVLLAVMAAVVSGVLPARKMTRGLGTQLRRISAGGGGQQFGGVWTVVIVGQLALTVIFISFSVYTVVFGLQMRSHDAGFAAEEYLSARITLDRPATAESGSLSNEEFRASYGRAFSELERRVAQEPGVADVTFAAQLPGQYHERERMDIDDVVPETADMRAALEYGVQTARVAGDFFDALAVPIVAGRSFTAAEYESDVPVVVVNEEFVDEVLGGHNAIGRRVRFLVSVDPDEEPYGAWHEIVGVVKQITLTNDPELDHAAGVYLPLAPVASTRLDRWNGASSVHMIVHTRGEPAAFATRLRTLAASIDPNLRVNESTSLAQAAQNDLFMYWFALRLLIIVSALGLLLSLTAIYSIMSFTVSRRTREIGIRIALGADRRRIVMSTLARPMGQAALGVVVGVAALVLIAGGINSLRVAAIVFVFTLIMLAVVAIACILPVRRALSIQPTEALKAEA